MLAAARADLAHAEWRREAARAVAVGAKIGEESAIAGAGEDHRRNLDSALAAKKQILDEVRAVRDRVHGQLRAQRQQGRLDAEIANRELVQAGKRTLDARAEADRWHAKAAEAEARRRAAWELTEARVRRYKMNQDERMEAASKLATSREEHGRRLNEETAQAFNEFYTRHDEHCATQERHAENALRHKHNSALASDRVCLSKVQAAKQQAERAAVQQAREVREAHEAAAAKVALAKRELADRHNQCKDALAQERICAAEAQRIAAEQRASQEADRAVYQGQLEAKLQRTIAHLSKGDVLPQERAQVAAARNEAWELRNRKRVEAAEARADQEEDHAEQRVRRAKIALKDLQAACAARINGLLEQWQEAKRNDDAKLKAAQARTEEILRYCQEQRERQESHHAKVQESVKSFADQKAAQLEEKVKTLAELSDHRVTLMQRQSQERRAMAEQQLEEMRRHIEDVRARCAERVRLEEEAAAEKVRIVRHRVAEATTLAELRAREAEAAQSAAQNALDEVAARCRGAAEEARRRGLLDIADLLMLPSSENSECFEEPPESWKPTGDGGGRGATASTAVPPTPGLLVTLGASGTL